MELMPYIAQGQFKFWCQYVLPCVYDGSLSYYELLCKVCKYLNDLIKNMDTAEENIQTIANTVDELQGYIDTYFDNLDVQEEINNKLDDMATNGTLANIFRDAYGVVSTLNFDYLVDSFIDRKSGKCWNGQFMCVGNGFMFVYRSGETGQGYVQKLNLSSMTEVVAADANLLHGGGACYGVINGTPYLIVAAGDSAKTLFFVDVNTLDIIRTMDTGEYDMSNIGYDTAENVFYRIIQPNTSDGDNRLLQKFTFAYTGDFVTAELSFNILSSIPIVINHFQGLNCSANGYLYTVTHGSNCIMAIDKNTGAILRRYKVPTVAGTSIIAEPEAVHVEANGDVYLYGSANLTGEPFGGISYTTIWKSNLKSNGAGYPWIGSVRNMFDTVSIHAKAAVEGGRYTFTEKRGTSGMPFDSVWGAMLAALALYNQHKLGEAIIHWNTPKGTLDGGNVNTYIFKDIPFRFYLTTDNNDPSPFDGSDPTSCAINLSFINCVSAIDIQTHGTLTLAQGNYTVTGHHDAYVFNRGAFVTVSSGDFVPNKDNIDINAFVVARGGIYTKLGYVPYTAYSE